MTTALTLAIAWLAVGAVSVAVLHRRGHDVFAWAVPFLFLGPFAIPVAISADRRRPAEPDRPLPAGDHDVLVALDDDESLDHLLQDGTGRASSITLAAVLDLEAPTTVRGHDDEAQARERLDAAVRRTADRTSVPVAGVVLYGEPRHALQHFATEHGYELLGGGRRPRVRHAVPVLQQQQPHTPKRSPS